MDTEQQVGTNTQPQAVNVDIDKLVSELTPKLSAIMDKKATGIQKSLIQQEYPDLDSQALSQIVNEWKSKQKTPEQLVEENYKNLLETSQKETQLEKETRLALEAKLETYELKNHGFTEEEDLELVSARIKKMFPEQSFAEAIKQYREKYPKLPPPPVPATGTGTKPVSNLTKEDIKQLSYMERLKLKNPTLYSQKDN